MTEKKTESLEFWKGGFGDDYIQRNPFSETKISQIVDSFENIMKPLPVKTVLEVGANVGNNLMAVSKLFKGRVKTFGLEPNKAAFETMKTRARAMNLEQAFNTDASRIPMDNGSVDLAFTSGVLIHIPPKDLGLVIDEIYRVSRAYIFCSEYFSHEPEEKTYHGKNGLLFKRDFGAFYLDRFPSGLTCVDHGFFWQRQYPVWDNLNWWLFKKTKSHGNGK